MESKLDNPSYYESACEIARPALAALGILDVDGRCIETLEEKYAWIIENAYVFLAVKYLWRCGKKEDPIEDVQKAIRYLHRCLTLEERLDIVIWSTLHLSRREPLIYACLKECHKLLATLRKAEEEENAAIRADIQRLINKSSQEAQAIDRLKQERTEINSGDVKHTWFYCGTCGGNAVICGSCGNNSCNGTYGKLPNGEDCPHCSEAYDLQQKYGEGVCFVLDEHIPSQSPKSADESALLEQIFPKE